MKLIRFIILIAIIGENAMSQSLSADQQQFITIFTEIFDQKDIFNTFYNCEKKYDLTNNQVDIYCDINNTILNDLVRYEIINGAVSFHFLTIEELFFWGYNYFINFLEFNVNDNTAKLKFVTKCSFADKKDVCNPIYVKVKLKKVADNTWQVERKKIKKLKGPYCPPK